jgi:hypothetical protein
LEVVELVVLKKVAAAEAAAVALRELYQQPHNHIP